GTVVGKQGRAYLVEVVEGSKHKMVLVTPEHLRRMG
ncbi:MAG: 50S ribosomal protein L21e, partial [Candidatus Altiarchaeota archaeon]